MRVTHVTILVGGISLAMAIILTLNYHRQIFDGTTNKTEISKKERLMAKFKQEIEMTKDPNLGFVPYERLLKAKDFTDKWIQKNKGRKAAISGVSWTNKGPMNIGGRTRAIMFDPNDNTNRRIFAGGVSGGLWKNEDATNASSKWTKINDFLDNLTITTIVSDPNNPMVFYAGTGESYTSVTPGLGIFKSTDGGGTWSALSSTSNFRYVNEIVVRNESGTSVIYAACVRKYIGSELTDPSSSSFYGMSGLFRSADGGTTWTQVMPNNDAGNVPGVDDVGIDANNALWASSGTNAFQDKAGDIYRCTDVNCDGISKFVKKYDASANGFANAERTVFALAPSDPNTVYAVTGKNGAGNQDIEYMIKTVDGGTTWTNLTIPKNYDLQTCTPSPTDHFTRAQATYDLCMTVHPTNPNLVLLGGIDVYRTIDGFASTQHIGSWYQSIAPCDKEIHADHHTFVFRPGSSNEVVFGTDGGVYYSNNAGDATVASPDFVHHVSDYNVSQMYAVDISPTSGAEEYIAGLQDNGTQDWDASSGLNTSEAIGGDGSFCHIDQNEPMVQIGAYIYNDFTQTTDEWATKTQISPTPQTGRFINPSDYDDTNNILYSASDVDQLCRVTGIGSMNPVLSDGIAVNGAALGGKQATTIRVDRNTPTTIYVGTDGAKVYKISSANTGNSLTSVDISTGLPSAGWVSSIDVEMGNSNHLLVTYSNYGIASVWESTDGGTSWNNVEGNLPDMPVRWGIFSPANNDHALVGTSLGIWSTDNLNGASTDWGVTNTGLANVRVDMLRYRMSDKTVIVGTHGRGIYTFRFDASCPDTLTVTDNPATGTYEANILVKTNDMAPVGVNSNAVFRSGQMVELYKDFEVSNSAALEVQIGNCNN